MTEITLIPADKPAIEDYQGFVLNGMPYFNGDTVWVTDPTTGSKLYGTVGYVYDAAVLIDAPFVGNMWFKFFRPQGYTLTLIERGGKADAFGLAWYMRHFHEGARPWSELTEATREGYILACVLGF